MIPNENLETELDEAATLLREAEKDPISTLIQIGGPLRKKKVELKHGNFGKWLKEWLAQEGLTSSEATARRAMRVSDVAEEAEAESVTVTDFEYAKTVLALHGKKRMKRRLKAFAMLNAGKSPGEVEAWIKCEVEKEPPPSRARPANLTGQPADDAQTIRAKYGEKLPDLLSLLAA